MMVRYILDSSSISLTMFHAGSIDTVSVLREDWGQSANDTLSWTESTIMADIRPLKLDVPNDKAVSVTLDSKGTLSVTAAVPAQPIVRPLQLLHAAIFLSGVSPLHAMAEYNYQSHTACLYVLMNWIDLK